MSKTLLSVLFGGIFAVLSSATTLAAGVSYPPQKFSFQCTDTSCAVDDKTALNGWGFGPANSVKGEYEATYCGGGLSCPSNPGGGSAIYNVTFSKKYTLTGYLYKITRKDGKSLNGMLPELTLTAPSISYIPDVSHGSHWSIFRKGGVCTPENFSQGCVCHGPTPQSCQFTTGN